MKRLIYFSLLLLIVFSCKEPSKDPLAEDNKELKIEEKLKLALNEDYLSDLNLPKETFNFILSYYTKTNFTPIWINDTMLKSTSDSVKKAIENPILFGIPNNRHDFLKTNKELNFLKEEILLTAKLAHIANDLENGIFSTDTLSLKSPKFIPVFKLKKHFEFSNFKIETIQKKIILWGSSNFNYQLIAQGIYDYCKTFPIDTLTYSFPKNSDDSIGKLLKIKIALINKGYLAKNDAEESLKMNESIKKFQVQNGLNPDGELGDNTIKALQESTYKKLLRAAITLDKWRTGSDYLKPYLRINIPEYVLTYHSDSSTSIHKIIVGQSETSTPELKSVLTRLILYPYWTVPQSIKTKEILPKLRVNPAYLANNHMRLFKNEIEISPYSINWNSLKNIPYKIRQEYGPNNSLGIIKFDFDNVYSVYIHDTPNKSLFNRDIRALSHGCMRCQNPLKLAKIILHNDFIYEPNRAIDSTFLDTLMSDKEHKTLKIRKPVQVYIEYKSITIKDNQLIFNIDIYKRDEKYIRLLLSR